MINRKKWACDAPSVAISWPPQKATITGSTKRLAVGLGLRWPEESKSRRISGDRDFPFGFLEGVSENTPKLTCRSLLYKHAQAQKAQKIFPICVIFHHFHAYNPGETLGRW